MDFLARCARPPCLNPDILGKVVWHNFIKLPLGNVRELEVLDLDSLSGVLDLVDLLLHLVEVPCQPLSVHRVG
jgi:hypothetical protein